MLGHLMGRRHDLVCGRNRLVGSWPCGVIGALSRQYFVRHAFGVAFLKLGHLQVMAGNLEISLAHVETRRSFGKMQIFGGAIPISPRPYPKSEFAYRISSWQAATHKMQQK
jgi:hypothetical protein